MKTAIINESGSLVIENCEVGKVVFHKHAKTRFGGGHHTIPMNEYPSLFDDVYFYITKFGNIPKTVIHNGEKYKIIGDAIADNRLRRRKKLD